MQSTTLIALDWGTTSLRAYRIGAHGVALEKRALPWGIMNLPPIEPGSDPKSGFDLALAEACGDWIEAAPHAAVIAAGMVGSAQGWKEARYLELPQAITDIGQQLTSVSHARGTLHIVPGLLQRGALPNVIRGEETQVVGALSELGQDEDVLIGLPGTHSKWVRVQGQRIVHFDTFMTGEVYAVLRRHAILGRTMLPGDHGDDVSFERGARVAISEQGQAGVLSTIFSSRTLGLTGELDGAAQAEYLSGVLIGHEIAALAATRQTAGLNPAPRIILIGDEQLCERYRKVLALHAMTTVNIAAAATEHGLWQIASQAGLLSSALPDKDTSC